MLALGSASGAEKAPIICHQYWNGAVQASNLIRVVAPAGTQLPVEHPAAVCFDLPVGELGLLRKSLERGSVEVKVFDTGGTQLMRRGTLFSIENVVDQGHIRLRAIFHHPN
jgi:hypothetical protein